MDSFNINISPETQEIVITQGEPINISINEDVIQINQTKENYNLNFEGEVVKIDANYPQAVEAARIATEKAAEATQIVEGFDEHAQGKIAEYDSNASDKIAEYNQNAIEKTNTFNSNATSKTTAYNDNASDKLSAYNQNDTEKTSAYNTNAQNKLDAYNTNDTAKTGAFNQNASDKTISFNDNYTDKLNDFNSNATDKTTDFNDNYIAKKEIIDEKAEEASGYADTAKQYAIGEPTEPTGGSAKHWAQEAESSLIGLSSRVTTIEDKIPSTASSDNQLIDKDYVDTADNGLQQQIDAITAASDVTDVVGTYAQLQAYDTSSLPNNSIIKVLQDESRNDETTYYRWVITAGVGAWVLIGEEGPYYTKAESDATFQEKLVSGTNIKTINNNSILGSGNVDIDALPSQTGQSGKYLTTNGISASWESVSVNPDNKSITLNGSSQLQTVGVIDQNNTSNAIKTWTGTRAQYNAITTKDANTLYNITDDTDLVLPILEALYPVGSVYETTNATCPLSALISGSTWVEETSRVLVDKGVNGSDWWELYSDGWCRQGGKWYVGTDGEATVSLSKNYSNSEYNVQLTSTQSSQNNQYNNGVKCITRTAGNFVIQQNQTAGDILWQTCGYSSTTSSHKRFRRTA